MANKMALFPKAIENYIEQLHPIENRPHHLKLKTSRAVERFNHAIQAVWSATPISNLEIYFEYSWQSKKK